MHRFDGYNIELTQGDTLFFALNLTGRELPEGSVAYFTVKTGPRSGEKLIEKKLDAGSGTLDIRLYSEDTDLPPRTYYWDLRVLIPLASGGYEVETPMEYAAFTILPAIGSAGDDPETPGMDADLPVLSLLVKEAQSLMDEMRTAVENGAFQGEAGPQGPQGEPGKDGVSPTVSFAATNDGYRITIVDGEGAKSVELKHGTDVSGNLMDATAYGSLRTVLAAPESEEYALGYGAFAAGDQAKASGRFSVARGVKTQATGYDAYAEGINTVASGSNSHAEGSTTTAGGTCAHAEGMSVSAEGLASHAEGMYTSASGQAGHSEGNKTSAGGQNAHAEGLSASAGGACSHAEGRSTVASGKDQHVQGRSNIEDMQNRYAHIVGNGETGAPSNAHTLDWSGNAWFAGDVYVGGDGQDSGTRLMKAGEVPEDLATKEYVDNAVSGGVQLPDGLATTEYVDEAIAAHSPDWNENDPQSPAYVKNRTHWLDAETADILKDVELVLDSES